MGVGGHSRGHPHAKPTSVTHVPVQPVHTGLQLLHQLAEGCWRQHRAIQASSSGQTEAAGQETRTQVWADGWPVWRAQRLADSRSTPLPTHLGWPCMPGVAASRACCSSSAALTAMKSCKGAVGCSLRKWHPHTAACAPFFCRLAGIGHSPRTCLQVPCPPGPRLPASAGNATHAVGR